MLCCVFEKYLEIEEYGELHGIPRLVCKQWAEALRVSMHTASATLPKAPRDRLQLYQDLASMPGLRSLTLEGEEQMSVPDQHEFVQLLRQNPILSVSGLPALPKLRRLGLERLWPFQSALCPYLELRQLALITQDGEVLDLSALQHLVHLTQLSVHGNDLGSFVRGLEKLPSLR